MERVTNMKRSIEYIVSIVMLIVLTVFASPLYETAVVISFALLITVLTLQSISDSFSIPLTVLQLTGSVIHGVFSQNPFCFLLMSRISTPKHDSLRIFTPALFLLTSGLIKGETLYSVLFYSAIITVISAILYATEKLIIQAQPFGKRMRLRRAKREKAQRGAENKELSL